MTITSLIRISIAVLILATCCWGCSRASHDSESAVAKVKSVVDFGDSNERQLTVLDGDVYQLRVKEHHLEVHGSRNGERAFGLTASNETRRRLEAKFDSESRLLELLVPVDERSYVVLKRVDSHWFFVDTNGVLHEAEFNPTVRYSAFKSIPKQSFWTTSVSSSRDTSD